MARRMKMTESQKRKHYEGWLDSGLTKNDYARQNEINIKTFGNFCRRFAVESDKGSDLVNAMIHKENDDEFKKETPKKNGNPTLRIKLPSGAVVEGNTSEIIEVIRTFKLAKALLR